MDNTQPTNTPHGAVDQLGEKLGRIKNDVKDVAGLAGEKIGCMTSRAVDGGKAAIESVSCCIKDNPLRSALVAIGIGALVGFLIRRR